MRVRLPPSAQYKEIDMKLEVGKYYKARNGMKAYVLSKDLPNPFFPSSNLHEIYIKVCYEPGDICVIENNGRVFESRESPQDLISEWVEPVRVKGWVNVFKSHYSRTWSLYFGDVYSTREEAIKQSDEDTIGQIYIDQEVEK